jgi:uncharacterized protein YyaL (SSP411 family)
MPNHLIRETSPYLLQHANNPVEWYPWGEAAFKHAYDEDKPILLSIGYSACHWCHVMAHESFENDEISKIMNENFINIKVDKEERPDIDSLYMGAVQILSGVGGWPLTVFLTPQGKPFYGGTYFPPQDRHGLPGLPTVLNLISNSYKENREQIDSISKQIIAILDNIGKNSVPQSLSRELLDHVFKQIRSIYDDVNGGFSTAPKFPQPTTLDFLMRYHHHNNNDEALEMVENTLNKMSKGGIYDQLGGGFHRYSIDNKWLVPHFEKMLYDNAMLSKTYLDAYLITGKPDYQRIIEGIIDYVLREMHSPEGGFYSSQDADTNSIEGDYYLWTEKEIRSVLESGTVDLIAEYYGISEKGNFEGKNILYIGNDKKALETAEANTIEHSRLLLLQQREKRVHPNCDEKVLASWNGLMLSSIAQAAIVLDRDDYRSAALSCGDFLAHSMIFKGCLQHVYKDGQAKVDGQLQDYSFVIGGFLSLHEMTMDIEWLRQAISLADTMLERFWVEEEKRFYDTSDKSEPLVVRPRNIYDDVVPSGNSFATMDLLRLSAITGNENYKNIAIYNLQVIAEHINRNPGSFTYWACTLAYYLSSVIEIAIITNRSDKNTQLISKALFSRYLPNKVVVFGLFDHIAGSPDIALLRGKTTLNGKTTAYICNHFSCQEPVSEVDRLIELLNRY